MVEQSIVEAATLSDSRLAIEFETPDLVVAKATPAPVLVEQPRADSVIEEVTSKVLTAKPIITQAPDYPYRAFRNGVEGHVKLQFNVDGRGRVKNVSVIESVPERTFDASAIRASSREAPC